MSGAWLNHTTKLMKNAIQVMCRILMFPENESRLSLGDDMVWVPA
jgi:hypothetical protein